MFSIESVILFDCIYLKRQQLCSLQFFFSHTIIDVHIHKHERIFKLRVCTFNELLANYLIISIFLGHSFTLFCNFIGKYFFLNTYCLKKLIFEIIKLLLKSYEMVYTSKHYFQFENFKLWLV